MNIVTNTLNISEAKTVIINSFFCILLFCQFLMYFFVFATYVFQVLIINTYYSNIN